MRRFLSVAFPSLLALMLTGSGLAGQSVLERSPNLSGGWVGSPGTLYFNFLHRFDQSDPPERDVSSVPTFVVAMGLPMRTLAGFTYATSSDVAPRFPNEWEFFARNLPLAQSAGAPLDLSLQAGYNLASASVDGEMALARRIGRARLMAAARAMSNGYHSGERRFAWAGGADVRLARFAALAGDVALLMDRREGERAAWGVGVQLAIPYTPHSLSLQATNTNTGTLQGASRGGSQVRYGFEFTIPVTLKRYLPRPQPQPPAARPGTPAPAADTADAAPIPDSAIARTPEAPAGTEAVARGGAAIPFEAETTPGASLEWPSGHRVAHAATAYDRSHDSKGGEPDAAGHGVSGGPTIHRADCVSYPFTKGVVRGARS